MIMPIFSPGDLVVLSHNKEKLSVILFDLGFTLINFEGDFNQAMKESYLALADSLITSGCQIERQAFADKFYEVISQYYRNRAVDLIERPIEENLLKTLHYFSVDHLEESVIQEAVKAMYLYTEAWWKLEPDTHATLASLLNMGYRLGLISNASNTPDLNRLIDNHRLRQYFEVIVISAEEGIRKPDPRIFTKTLKKLGVKPENAIMVGDTLPADILGAQNSGVKSVWITRRANRAENNDLLKSIHPDYTIPDLASLIPLLEEIESLD
jgi:HAD superfamily hydrolase (TIGR01662 family)